MTKRMASTWLLQQRLEDHHIHSTNELMPLLAERGIQLGRTQCFRLVTQTPQYISLDILAALCDIFDCTPNDLIKVDVVNEQKRKRVGEAEIRKSDARVHPLRTRVRRPN